MVRPADAIERATAAAIEDARARYERMVARGWPERADIISVFALTAITASAADLRYRVYDAFAPVAVLRSWALASRLLPGVKYDSEAACRLRDTAQRRVMDRLNRRYADALRRELAEVTA